MSYTIQTKFGTELNRPYEEDLLIHDWYRFVLSYPPHLVKNYLGNFKIDRRHCVLDPFCGTGTTLVECKKNNITSIGIEANPVVQLMAETKTRWDIDSNALKLHAKAVFDEAELRLKSHKSNLRTLTEEQENLIISDSISPLPLHKSLILLDVINDLYDTRFSNYAKTAFAKQLVYSFSNLKFGPEVGVSRKKKIDVNVNEIWLLQINEMADNISFLSKIKNANSTVHLGDSRSIGSILQHSSIDAVITSPPYPNEKDYSRTTRLESVLLGFVRT